MTKEEILAMDPREIDYRIAEKVFDYKVTDSPTGSQIYIHEKRYNRPNDKHSGYSWGEIVKLVPKYSSDISSAWEVIEILSNKGFLVCLNSVGENAGGFIRGTSRLGDWHCNVRGIEGEPNHVYETSAPEAICKAALLAVMDS